MRLFRFRSALHQAPACLLLLLAPCVVACSPSAHLEAADQPDEPHPIQVTVWRDGFELFVEYPPPVAGEPLELITHVSDTRTDLPRSSGPVTFRMDGPQGSSSTHVEPEPTRPGIYLPQIRFPSAGDWDVAVEIPLEGTVTVVPLTTVRVWATAAEATAAIPPPEPEGTVFLKEQQWRLATHSEPAREHELTRRVKVPAVVRAAPDREARVTPSVAGRLEIVEARGWPRLGQEVDAGELLAYVSPPISDYLVRLQGSQAEVLRSQLALARAEQVLERVERLHAEGARTERDLEQARFEVRMAQAERESAEAVANALQATGAVFASDESGTALPRFELRAPLAGLVREMNAVPGEFVEVNQGVLVLRDSSVVHVEAQLRPEVLEDVIDREQALFVRLRGAQDEDAALPLPGAELLMVGDGLEPHSLTVPVVYEVPDPDGRLRIGELIEVHLALDAPVSTLALPISALVEEEGRPVVYVQLSGEVFEKRYPTLGFRDGELVQVLSEIEVGERVVTHGGYAIRLAASDGSVPAHGHGH